MFLFTVTVILYNCSMQLLNQVMRVTMVAVTLLSRSTVVDNISGEDVVIRF